MSTYNTFKALSQDQQKTVLEACEEISEQELEEFHDQMLMECCEPYQIGGLTYQASDVLKAVDPVAYRCSFSDFIGDEDSFIEIDGKYYDTRVIEEAIEALEATEEEIEELL